MPSARRAHPRADEPPRADRARSDPEPSIEPVTEAAARTARARPRTRRRPPADRDRARQALPRSPRGASASPCPAPASCRRRRRGGGRSEAPAAVAIAARKRRRVGVVAVVENGEPALLESARHGRRGSRTARAPARRPAGRGPALRPPPRPASRCSAWCSPRAASVNRASPKVSTGRASAELDPVRHDVGPLEHRRSRTGAGASPGLLRERRRLGADDRERHALGERRASPPPRRRATRSLRGDPGPRW